MANISRNSFQPSQNYDKVIIQQGVPITDYDLNEMQDIIRYSRRKLVIEIFGNCFIEDGWKIVGINEANNFQIKAGPCYREGYRIALPADTTATDYGLTLTTPTEDRTDVVYIDFYEVEIDSVADPAIIHPKLADAGIEPSRRIKLKVDLRIAEGGSLPVDGGGHYYIHLADINRVGGNALITPDMVVDRRVSTESFIGHTSNKNNPHKVTVTQIGAVALDGSSQMTGKLKTPGIEMNDTQIVYNSSENCIDFIFN